MRWRIFSYSTATGSYLTATGVILQARSRDQREALLANAELRALVVSLPGGRGSVTSLEGLNIA
jgi:hypothetical protein